jgi:hypothetical protein
VVLYYLFELVMKQLGYESLGAFDFAFFLDDPKNYSNIVGAIYFDSYDYESMKSCLHAKTENLHKCRSKVEKVFGIYWYKKMSKSEWEGKKGNLVVLLDNVHTDQELNEFMVKQHTIREPLDNTQFRFFLIPNFKDGQGICLFKAHHSFGDGTGCS